MGRGSQYQDMFHATFEDSLITDAPAREAQPNDRLKYDSLADANLKAAKEGLVRKLPRGSIPTRKAFRFWNHPD